MSFDLFQHQYDVSLKSLPDRHRPHLTPLALLRHAAPCALCLGLFVSPAGAQTLLRELIIESAQLGGSEASAEASGSAVSVVTREEIERRQIRHAADALRALPGVYLDRSGGAGSASTIRVRGAEANHTTVLIDGVEVNALGDGGFDFASLLAADIERIEVLRGPQSGIYGGNALAGVVNIITRKGGSPQVSLQTEAGSLNTREVAGNLSTGDANGYVSLSGARHATDGFNIADVGSEKDGSEQSALFARAGYAFTRAFRLDGMLRRQTNKSAVDEDSDWDNIQEDVPGIDNDRQQTLAHLVGTLSLFDGAFVQKLQGSLFDDTFDTQSLVFGNGTQNGERSEFSYLGQLNWADGGLRHTLSGLVDLGHESFSSSNISGHRNLNQTGYVAEYRLDLQQQLYLSSNLRFDDNDHFEDATTYRLGASYRLPLPLDATRLHASYGRGIKNPTMIELYGWGGNFIGNPNLQPEESIGWDIGVEQGFLNRRLLVDITHFSADLTNEITADDSSPPAMAVNLSGVSRRQGVEVALTAHPTDGLSVSASYTYTDARRADGVLEQRRPYHMARGDIAWQFLDGRGKIDLEAIYRGEVHDIGIYYADTRVDGYTLVNLAASYQLSDNIELFGRAENLLNADYQEIYGYNTAPLTVMAGMKLKLAGAE